MKSSGKERSPRKNTFAALTQEKPRRGRPKHAIPRQSVYVALSKAEKQLLSGIAAKTPASIKRSDIPDMAILLLSHKLDMVRQAVAGRSRDLPEGITDFESLYYLWDLPVSAETSEKKWTSIRLSPTWAVEFGRLQGTFKALFGTNRSDVFVLAIVLL
ncbi:MAG TPA: hypothetical protein ENJ56_06495, partial [Anaerolineae bacterium]|nr:hypothetical protein [Anaerolineae bacterium]